MAARSHVLYLGHQGDGGIYSRYLPITAKPGGCLQKYFIRDNFLDFWFRFIHRNHSAVETGNFGYLREVIDRDYAT